MPAKAEYGSTGRREILGCSSSSWPAWLSVKAMNFLPSSVFFAPSISAMLAGTMAVSEG
ncbi:hypothetical protein D3C73_1070340 [compost metagenome]